MVSGEFEEKKKLQNNKCAICKQEVKELADVNQLLKNLLVTRNATYEVNSLFDRRKNVSFDNWVIVLFRVSSHNTTNISIDLRSHSSQFVNDRHVYGLAEGLDVTGRHAFYRFDFVNDNRKSRYGRVKMQSGIAESADEPSAKRAFIKLFEGGELPTRKKLFIAQQVP
mgnify:CR=1 FL=1